MENDFSMKMQWYTQSYARTSPKRITDLCCRTPASHAAEGARRPPCPPNDRQEESNRQLNSEVDLHITELLDNTNGLSNADMLDYQLEKFHEVLTKYAANKGQKIVFIHGKGDGVLRKAIEKELKTKYKQYYYQDASFREYGFGATMVTIK